MVIHFESDAEFAMTKRAINHLVWLTQADAEEVKRASWPTAAYKAKMLAKYEERLDVLRRIEICCQFNSSNRKVRA